MPAILYISAWLPARSETFVYREVFALRARGVTVHTASVHPPERGLGESRLDHLAASAIPIYGAGPIRLLRDAAAESLFHPIRAARTLVRAAADILTCDDVRWVRRPRLIVQVGAGLALARRTRRVEPAASRGGPAGAKPSDARVTHIHAHMAHVPATIAMVAAHQLGVPFSVTGHANDIFPNRALLRPKLRRAAFVACISRWHRSFYHSLHPTPIDRLPVIRCGVPMATLPGASGLERPPSRNLCEPAIEPRGPSATHPASASLHIVAVGRLIRKKGFDTLLEAFELLLTQDAPLAASIRISIVGDGPELSMLRAQADRLAEHHRLPAAAIGLLGALPNQRVCGLMQEADLFVLPCRVDPGGDRDGIPVVLMEAMAGGVPVISGRLPAIEELVEHDATGLLVEPGSPDALAAAIHRILTDRALRTALAVAGRRRVVEEFSEEVNIARLMTALGVAPGFAGEPAPNDPERSEEGAGRPSPQSPHPSPARAQRRAWGPPSNQAKAQP